MRRGLAGARSGRGGPRSGRREPDPAARAHGQVAPSPLCRRSSAFAPPAAASTASSSTPPGRHPPPPTAAAGVASGSTSDVCGQGSLSLGRSAESASEPWACRAQAASSAAVVDLATSGG